MHWVHAKSEGPFLKKNSYNYIQILTLFLIRELTDEESWILIARIEGKFLMRCYHFKIKTVLYVKEAFSEVGVLNLETVLWNRISWSGGGKGLQISSRCRLLMRWSFYDSFHAQGLGSKTSLCRRGVNILVPVGLKSTILLTIEVTVFDFVIHDVCVCAFKYICAGMLYLFFYKHVLHWFQSLVAFPKLKRQVLLFTPELQSPKDFDENTMFWVNQEFALV